MFKKEVINEEIFDFFCRGVIEKICYRGDGFVFNVFVWFKEVGSYCMILNLGLLNEFVGY